MSKPDHQLVKKLRAVMPAESTIDTQAHAEHVAATITHARQVRRNLQAAALRTWLEERR